MKTITREQVQLKAEVATHAVVSYRDGDVRGTLVGLYFGREYAEMWASIMQRELNPLMWRFEVQEIVD